MHQDSDEDKKFIHLTSLNASYFVKLKPNIDEKHKNMRKEREDLVGEIETVNDKIIATEWHYDVELRKYNDPKLILNEQKKTHSYK